MIFGLCQAACQLRHSSEGAGAARRLFDGADTTGEIRFTSDWFQRKQKRRILFEVADFTRGAWKNAAPFPVEGIDLSKMGLV